MFESSSDLRSLADRFAPGPRANDKKIVAKIMRVSLWIFGVGLAAAALGHVIESLALLAIGVIVVLIAGFPALVGGLLGLSSWRVTRRWPKDRAALLAGNYRDVVIFTRQLMSLGQVIGESVSVDVVAYDGRKVSLYIGTLHHAERRADAEGVAALLVAHMSPERRASYVAKVITQRR